MTIKLYLVNGSPNCRKVEAVANHLGIKAEIIRKDFFDGGLKKDEFLAINPNGMVPALEDGDLRLFESEAIISYLCSKAPDQVLLPEDPKVRADIQRWQFWSVSHYNRALGGLLYETVLKPNMLKEKTDESMVKRHKEMFERFAPVLEKHLAGKEFVVGGEMTLADYSLAQIEPFIEQLPIELGKFPNIKAMYERMRKNPHWSATEVAPEKIGKAA